MSNEIEVAKTYVLSRAFNKGYEPPEDEGRLYRDAFWTAWHELKDTKDKMISLSKENSSLKKSVRSSTG